MQISNVIVNENCSFSSSFNGVIRDDWWGDMEEIKNLTTENHDYVDFLLEVKINYIYSEFLIELKKEFNSRIKSRNYPPGFSYYV